MANQKKEKYPKEPIRTKKTSKLPEARENAGDQVVIGFSFVSDWSRERREFSKPITERSKAKPMQSEITFNTQLKLA